MLLGSKVHRTPGDRWMIHGPTDYIPRTEIGNIQRRLVFMYLQNYVYQFNCLQSLGVSRKGYQVSGQQ